MHCIPSHWPYSGLIGCIGRYSTGMIHVRAVCGAGGGVVAGRRSAAGGQGILARRGRLPFRTRGGASVEREIETAVETSVVQQQQQQQQQSQSQSQSQQQPRPRPRNALGKTVALAGLAGFSLVMSSGLLSSVSSPSVPFASLALAVPAVSAVSADAMATAFRSAWAGLAAGWVLDSTDVRHLSDSLTRATRYALRSFATGVCIHWLERTIWLR